jgi:hypothetical protein
MRVLVCSQYEQMPGIDLLAYTSWYGCLSHLGTMTLGISGIS